jgi:enterochelin esterase family protein
VPGPAPLPWEKSEAPAGDLARHEYRSARFGEMREVWVYTPPGYEAAGERRYPVLYLLHGALDDARAWTTAGRADVILDNLHAAGTVEPMIVAMPLGYGFPDARRRVHEIFSPATDQRAVMDAFAAGLLDEVVPLVERRYRTRPEASSRAIAGLSMGGAQALFVGFHHAERFGTVAAFGAAVVLYSRRYEEWFPDSLQARAGGRGFLAMSVGREDFLLQENRHFVAWLDSRGLGLELEEVSGGHTWNVWRRELIRLAPRLFRACAGDCGGAPTSRPVQPGPPDPPPR